MLKLVAFDCDGVLFDSRQANIAYYNAILSRFGRAPMDPEAADFVHSHTALEALTHLFQDSPEFPEVLRFYRTMDYQPFIPMMVEEPHLREFLQFLRPAYRTALITNRTTTTRSVLRYHGLEQSFDAVLSAQDVSRPKPHPEAFSRLLSHFGLAPREAVYIGDSRVDEEFAANAGVPLVAYRNPELDAAYHLDSFAAGPDLIQTLTRKESTMQKYQCEVCGYIYEPEAGDPENNVPPQTPFEKLPDDWVCPLCGAPKEQFAPVD